MLCGESGDVSIGFSFGLLDESHAAALVEPGRDASVKGAVAASGEDTNLAACVGLGGVVLLHRSLTGGELLLDLAALVAARAGELLGSVGEFVAVELELGLGGVKIVGAGGRLLEGGGDRVNLRLVFFDECLELSDSLLNSEGIAGEGAGLESRLAQGEGEGLVDFMVSEPGGLVGVGLLLGGDRKRGERLDGLPWALIDKAIGTAMATVGFEEWHVSHCTARPPGCREAEDEESCGNCDGETAEFLHSSTLYAS